MSTTVLSTEELLAQLSTPTEFKTPPTEELAGKFIDTEHANSPNENIEGGPSSNGTHTASELSQTATEQGPVFTENDFANMPAPPDESLVKDSGFWKKQAAFWIGTVNVLQKKFLPSVYKKALLQEKDSVILKDWREKKKRNPGLTIEDAITEDDQLFHALDRYEALEAACTSIEFTQEEMDMISEPLARVLEKHQTGTTTPEAQLTIAVALVMLPRILPFFPGLSNFTIPTK